MSIYLFSILLAIVALAALFGAFKALIKSGWFLKWLQGSAGFMALVLTVASALLVVDLLSYIRAEENQSLATLTFTEIDQQEFDVELVRADGSKDLYKLNGDQWQLDVRLIGSPLFSFDKLPSYKLDRLSGRYLSLEQERTGLRTVYGLVESNGLDFWQHLAEKSGIGLLDAQYGSASFMPMSNGAIYRVVLHEDGIQAQPVNEIAKRSLGEWN